MGKCRFHLLLVELGPLSVEFQELLMTGFLDS